MVGKTKFGGNRNGRGLDDTRSRKDKRKRLQEGGDINYKDITIGILSYKDCKTILNTLESYKKNGLLDLVNTVIFFQEIGDFERSIAEKYNIRCLGSETNIGLQKGLLELINNTTTKYFISAQSDFELICDEETLKKTLDDGIKLLENDNIHQVKLVDHKKSTEFSWALDAWKKDFLTGNRKKEDYPWKLEALGLIDNFEETFPNVYKIINYNYKWYICTTKDNKWSDHIFITKTDFMKNTIVPIINSNPSDVNNHMIFENSMDKYVETHPLNIASKIDGPFIHKRLDKKSDNSVCDLNQYGGSEKTKAYIINLDKRTDRWEQIQNNLKDTDLDIERISAVYDKDGHKGCALSIQKIVQMAKDSGMKTVLFIEDDNMITEDFNNRWKVAKEWLDSNLDKWEIFNGGPSMHNIEQKFELIVSLPHNVTLLKAEKIINTNFMYINSSVYDKILDIKNSGNHYPIDNNLGNPKEFNVIFINPFIGVQAKNHSNINNKVKNHNEHSDKTQDYLSSMFGKKGGDQKIEGYVINLEKRKEKYEKILKEFENTNIKLERFNAIEHMNGHVGCGESHKAIVRKAKEENRDTVLILEDDCRILDTEKFNKRWPVIKQWLDNNMDKWEVFNGGPVDHVGEMKEYEIDSENILYSLEAAKCTQFMYVNKSAYDKILEWTYEKDWLYDYGFVNTPKFKNLSALPPLTTQHNGYSDTEHHNKVYKGGQEECNISYFTVSTKDKPELQRLKSSAEKFGWKLDILGLEQNTDKLGWGNSGNKEGNYGNFSIKLIKQLEYVSTKNPDDILLFTDAWDVVCIGDCKTLYERYLTFNKDIVFGAEKECSPDRDKKDLYKNKDLPFPYLNSGFFIGKAGVMKKYLEHINGEKDDQRFWTKVFLDNEDTIGIDSYAKMALQTWDTDNKNYQFQDNKFTYLETNTNPIFIHSNGYLKDKLDLFTPLIQTGGDNDRTTAYVINLIDRKDRKDEITEKFKNSSFDLEFIEAIRVKEGENGNIGLGESFKKVVRERGGNIPILILEDDCNPINDYDNRWKIVKQWLNNNLDKWEIISGGASMSVDSDIKLEYKIDDNNNLFSAKKAWGTHCTYINPSIFNKILDYDFYKNGPLDVYLNTINNFKFLILYPFIATQSTGYSNIQKKIIVQDNNYISELFEKELTKQTGGNKRIRRTKRKNRKVNKRRSRRIKGGKNTKIHYITVSTKDKPELQSLIRSAKKYNWDLEVLGMEIGTNQLGHKNKQFGMKLRYVKDYLKKCDSEDLLLLTDAWDVNIFGTKEEMLERYNRFNTSIIFNAEKFCWPDESRRDEYDSLNEEFPFLNSGGYIGKVKDLRICLNDYNNEDEIDDQRFWTDQYFKHRDLIKLDFKNEIFICTPATDRTDYSIDNGKLKYKNAYPIVLHRNGPGKENYLDLVQSGGNQINELTDKLTFLVYTNSEFDDVLELFLKQYEKCLSYFPISIGTDNKKLIEDKYSKKYDFIKNIYQYNNDDEYYDRIKGIISNINTKYLLFNHENNVIQKPVPIENIKKIMDEIESKNMDQLRLSDSGEKNPVYSEDTFVHKINGPFFISIQTGIWKKDVLLDIVTKFPNTNYRHSEEAEIQEYVKQFNNYYSTNINDIRSNDVNVSIFSLFPIIHMTSHGKYLRHLYYVDQILKDNNVDPSLRV